MKRIDSKMFYFLIGCVSLVFLVVGATYAYFTASATDDKTVKGNAATVTFGLSVNKITTVDMAYGLVPMKNKQAPNAAAQKCLDDLGNAGCQMYKITINADCDTVMFLDGYVVVTPMEERLSVRFTQIFSDGDGENYHTGFTNDEYAADKTKVEADFIRNGQRISDPQTVLNHAEDAGCLLVENEKIGGEVGRQKVFYMMIWVYDNGEEQDYLQGLQLAYRGVVTFVTAEGNEISATFD